jgi:hypothetical protein
MKKNKIIGTVAVVAIATMFALNINYAIEGYGIKNVSLHPEVIAQTNGTGGGTTGGGTTGGSTTGGSTTGGKTTGGSTTGGSTLNISIDVDKNKIGTSIKYETQKNNGIGVSISFSCAFAIGDKCPISGNVGVTFKIP